MNFSGPFFLNLILRAISTPAKPQADHLFTAPILDSLEFYSFAALSTVFPSVSRWGSPSSTSDALGTTNTPRSLERSDAYFFAFAWFICQLIKAQSELQHLYFSRRATIRIDGELVASVYEKILRHKDISSVASANKAAGGKGDSAENEEDVTRHNASGGDVGRIMSLISADAWRLAITFSQGPYVYDVFLSIIVACIMLYSYMAWTAFTGYLVLLLAFPFNSLIGNRADALHRAEATMRDRRIRAVNEAVQAAKFIKFSAWESRWVQRVLGVRTKELQWLRKLKIAYFFLSIMWVIVPIFVAAVSFSCFTLVAKRELTVDIAFPCIAIFAMLSTSLTALPMITNWAIQCLIALRRIDDYLSEPDVPRYVSSLRSPTNTFDEPFGSRVVCSDAAFRWPTSHHVNQPANQEAKSSGIMDTFRHVRSFMTSIPARLLGVRRARSAEVPREEHPTTESEDPEPVFELRDISVVFPECTLSLVCGPTGSGKSAFLASLLGETDCIKGKVYLPRDPRRSHEVSGLPLTVSYCAQQPWLEHKSIKDNILFGSLYERERYEATLRCCALLPDLEVLDHGDNTEIGEKGVSLSGGQKARVALARAVYSRTQVVLLDDILSAVDSHTAEQLVNQCLLGPLMRNRTIILVTHHIDLVLPAVGWIVKLRDGKIEAQGTVAQLRESRDLEAGKESHKNTQSIDKQPLNNETAKERASDKPANKLVESEAKSSGAVRLTVYQTYLSASSYWLFGILVACLASNQLLQLGEKLWIKHWGESYKKTPNNRFGTSIWSPFELPPANQNVLPYLMIYVAIQGMISLMNMLSQFPKIVSSLRASRILFEKMLRSVLRSPSRFFDKTPSGRILNRFRSPVDIDAVDGGIQDSLVQVIRQVAALGVAAATIVYVIPPFIVPGILVAILHLYFARGYISASRDLRRIESNTRSVIMSSFSELIVGVVTVRAFSSEKPFLETLYDRLDRTRAASHFAWMCNRWLVFRFDTLAALCILVTTVGSLMSGASAGLVGIVIVQAQQFVQALYMSIRVWTELEQSFNSVERIQEYLDLPSEPPMVIESSRPPASWPVATGTLVVQDLVIKYSPELEPALNGISFETKPSEKIGIVGRTGSGKSTLALALFRFVEPTAGTITLDGIDITAVGVEDWDVVLFNGTMRENLDPFKEHDDATLYDALRRVYLYTSNDLGGSTPKSHIQSEERVQFGSSSQGHTKHISNDSAQTGSSRLKTNVIGFTLDSKISDGGNNLSHGQRQLLAMARALLRKSNVIVMDESTASVDFETDAKIQTTIREEFRQSILLTIAHRLRTVIDNDRILVLSAGRVAEFDTPANLLAKPDGVFHDMCRKSGDYHELLKMAGIKSI
ncbi:ABC transporter transmembrane region [Ceratobasidium sp. AG-Ba]|nr:ABC transporter transmembrane region [Ceratobasidium sp. AG-Ba]